MLKMVLLSIIKDNPHRNKKRNPIKSERVNALVESINATSSFWVGVYGREVGDYVEIAFGHHRVDAARKVGLKEIPIEIMELSDSDMLMRMTRENLVGELTASLEVVSAAVKSFGAGTIAFETPSKDTRKDMLRYAPSFIPGKAPVDPGSTRPYSADTLARFLGGIYVLPDGHAQATVRAALGVLELEEREIKCSEANFQHNGAGPDGRYIGAKEIIARVAEIKERDIKTKENAEKDAEKREAAAAKRQKDAEDIKVRQLQEKKEREELLRKRMEAVVEENANKVKRIAEQIRKKAEAAEAKAEADKARMAAHDANIEALKKAEAESRKEDEYLPIRREADRIIHILERRDLEEDVKALSRRPLNAQDRERIRQAALTLGTWYAEWVATRFLPPTTARKRIAKEKR